MSEREYKGNKRTGRLLLQGNLNVFKTIRAAFSIQIRKRLQISAPPFAEGRRAGNNLSFSHTWSPNNVNHTSRCCLNIYSNTKNGSFELLIRRIRTVTFHISFSVQLSAWITNQKVHLMDLEL